MIEVEKNCNSCVNCLYDEERAHYKCWLTNKVIYNSENESCDDWGKYAGKKAGKKNLPLTIHQSNEIKID